MPQKSDDGRYRLGIHDAGPGFETRRFVASVLARERPPPDDLQTRRAAPAEATPSDEVQPLHTIESLTVRQDAPSIAPDPSDGFEAVRYSQDGGALAAALRAALIKKAVRT